VFNTKMFMRLRSLAGWVIAALTAAVFGCADQSLLYTIESESVAEITVSGTKQDVAASHPTLFDLYVSGESNTVRVPAGSAVRTLWISGANHRITVLAGASVQSIRVAGMGTTIELPASLHVTIGSSSEGQPGNPFH
jgi:hypothetical protein